MECKLLDEMLHFFNHSLTVFLRSVKILLGRFECPQQNSIINLVPVCKEFQSKETSCRVTFGHIKITLGVCASPLLIYVQNVSGHALSLLPPHSCWVTAPNQKCPTTQSTTPWTLRPHSCHAPLTPCLTDTYTFAVYTKDLAFIIATFSNPLTHCQITLSCKQFAVSNK